MSEPINLDVAIKAIKDLYPEATAVVRLRDKAPAYLDHTAVLFGNVAWGDDGWESDYEEIIRTKVDWGDRPMEQCIVYIGEITDEFAKSRPMVMVGSSEFGGVNLGPYKLLAVIDKEYEPFIVRTQYGSVRAYRYCRHMTIEERELYEQQQLRDEEAKANESTTASSETIEVIKTEAVEEEAATVSDGPL